MGKLFKYPDGSTRDIEEKKQKKSKNLTKANLGSDFEDEINESNEYYQNKNIAVIHKKPTPVQIVKVDYPARNKAKIVEAYYKTDYPYLRCYQWHPERLINFSNENLMIFEDFIKTCKK